MNRTRILRTAVIAVALIVGLSNAVTATPTISITAPATGSTISGTETPTMAISGLVGFETPEPTEQTFYTRRTSCNADKRLSIVQGSETSACAENYSYTPVNEVDQLPTHFDAVDGVPFTLDTSRDISGVVTLTSFQPGVEAGGGQVIIDVQVSGVTEGTTQILGSTTMEYMALPTEPPRANAWTVSPPESLNKRDFTSLRLSVTVHGVHAMHGYIQPNTTNVTLPTFSASFDRQVEVGIDGGAYSSAGVEVSEDGSWSAERATPPAGSHQIRARAVQGAEVSSAAVSDITVTA